MRGWNSFEAEEMSRENYEREAAEHDPPATLELWLAFH